MLWIWNWAAVKSELQARGCAEPHALLFGGWSSGEPEKSGLQREGRDTINYHGEEWLTRRKISSWHLSYFFFQASGKTWYIPCPSPACSFRQNTMFCSCCCGWMSEVPGLRHKCWYLGRSVFTPSVPSEKERGCEWAWIHSHCWLDF